jgi:hypothetical protein
MNTETVPETVVTENVVTENVVTENVVTENVKPEITQVKLVDIPITNENDALNIMVSFLTLGHKRGAFTLDEAAKIWECIRTFHRPV